MLTRAFMAVPLEALVAEAVVRARAVVCARGVGVAQLLLLRADVDWDADIATGAKVHLVGDDIFPEPVFALT